VAPRLGNVLYMLACVLAVLVLALGATVFFLADPSSKPGQHPIAVLAVSVMAAVLIWSIGEGQRYILTGASTHLKREQLEERLAALEQRVDSVDTRLTRYEETVGPQLKTLGSLLHQALSKRDKKSHGS
jgi:sulfur relay (sulfurtransferase) DsrF/TusC family protein